MAAQVQYVHIQERGVILHFEHGHLHPAPREIHRVSGCVVTQQINDFICCNLFWIEEQIDAHFRKYVLVLERQVFLGVDAGGDFAAAELLGQNRADNVHVL